MSQRDGRRTTKRAIVGMAYGDQGPETKRKRSRSPGGRADHRGRRAPRATSHMRGFVDCRGAAHPRAPRQPPRSTGPSRSGTPTPRNLPPVNPAGSTAASDLTHCIRMRDRRTTGGSGTEADRCIVPSSTQPTRFRSCTTCARGPTQAGSARPGLRWTCPTGGLRRLWTSSPACALPEPWAAGPDDARIRGECRRSTRAEPDPADASDPVPQGPAAGRRAGRAPA